MGGRTARKSVLCTVVWTVQTNGMRKRAGATNGFSGTGPRAGFRRQVMVVQRLANQGLDHGLPAHVQFFCSSFQLFEHRRSEIDIHTLNRPHHPARVGEKA